MSGDVHVRFCERLGGRFPGATRRNIFVKTPKAAERVMTSIGGYIETRLKLVVNREKSQVARSDRVKFLGLNLARRSLRPTRA
jgi:RNA-directed DNA polymerase